MYAPNRRNSTWKCLQSIINEVPTHTSIYAHICTYVYTYLCAWRANINIQFKLLQNWLSQISIMHLFHFRWRQLKAPLRRQFSTLSSTNLPSYTHIHIHIHTCGYMLCECLSSISNLICQSSLSWHTINKIHQTSLNLSFNGRQLNGTRGIWTRTWLVIKVNMDANAHIHMYICSYTSTAGTALS